MSKKAFVFDTNFIIQNYNLNDVVKNLNEKGFVVYITQVAIDERIAQECIKQRAKYDKLESFKKEVEGFASITITEPYEKTEKLYKEGMQKKYETLFGANIIPFDRSEKNFNRILQRAYMKVPPFITSGTDKGFKDSLMWLSILDFFSSNGEDEVVFVSNDNGFKENSERLCTEFRDTTSKIIEIKDNSYYKTILDSDAVKKENVKPNSLPDVSQLRKRIRSVLESLCWCEVEDSWGQPEFIRTFTLTEKVDADYMEAIMNGLKRDISTHLFDESVPAFNIFALDDRVVNGNANVSVADMEAANKLFEEIKEQYPEYIKQFYSTAANIFNEGYIEPVEVNDDDLPF
ncbi:MAG: DUF4935 domain-containing protein [Clostridia bacterium]|nr:DUF4935 domain-containing protein [Clostridia bacterium]